MKTWDKKVTSLKAEFLGAVQWAVFYYNYGFLEIFDMEKGHVGAKNYRRERVNWDGFLQN